MFSITTDLADVLGTIRSSGTFFVSGSEPMPAPGLEVDGVGPLGLPLPAVQAEQLIARAERAPYGRGEATVTDIAVRRTWQISPAHVHIRGKHWPATLQAIVARVAEGLDIADSIDAELYKMLIYDEGSFFVPHRDTEKSPGMFATLVLALPSVSEGGALIVRHKDHEARLELGCEDPSEVAFGAFFADCVHEVLPVTAGHRLVLVYNLLRRGPGRPPGVPNFDGKEAMVAAQLVRWSDELRAGHEDAPEKLIYPLEHAYTPAELGFRALKGADAGIAQVVVSAAEQAGCSVHLALVSVEESGSAQQTGGFRRYRHSRYYDDEADDAGDVEFEVVEVIDQTAVASHWRRPDGEPSPLTDLPVEETEFSPPVSFEDLDPDEEHFHEATGNAGATYERTYRRAALILWPQDRVLAVINQGGLTVTLPFLEDLVTRWTAGGDSAIRAQADELSRHMIGDWPMGEWYPRRDSGPTDAGRFLGLLVRLDATARVEHYLTRLADRHGFDAGDSADIADGLRTLPADRAAGLTQTLVEGAAATALAACGALLARVSGWGPAVAAGAARTLVGSLPDDPKSGEAATPWRRAPGVGPQLIVDLFTALGRIDAALAATAADHVLAWPLTYDFDTVLCPAVLLLLNAPDTTHQAPVQRLRSACAEHLDRRIALDLKPPGDWRRDNTVGCTCVDCLALARFLANPGQEVWVFAAAQNRRSHVENTIRHQRCDVNFITEKRGSPHRLVCTKNDASYRRRCVQRATDLKARGQLQASG